MNVVGFDVGKLQLYAARIDRSGMVKERLVLNNTREAVLPELKRLKSKYKHLLATSEATGDHHRTLALCCLELGITFRLLNPISVKRYIRGTVRKRKTDMTDAEAVARTALQGEGTDVTQATFGFTKTIFRTGSRLVDLALTLQLMEARTKRLLGDYPELVQTVHDCQVKILQAGLVFREAAAKDCDQALLKLLRTIPGIGPAIAPALVTEIGDITRFKGPRQLIAYAGLDPKIMQSGATLNRYGHLTKRGAPQLRHALFIAGSVAKTFDPSCRKLYEKKRAEGKRYKEATIVVARKMVRIIYAVWTSGRAYELKG
jgi:transposase